MCAYAINGITLFAPSANVPLSAAAAPSSHSVTPSQPTIVQSIGGHIAIEPPSGKVNVHNWNYSGLHASAVALLKSYIGDNPLCYIDTYTEDGVQLTGVPVLVAWPEIKSTGRRDRVDAFSLVFTEIRSSS